MSTTLTAQVIACDINHGVLIAQFVRHEVVSESAVHDAEQLLLARLPKAENGVVVDCSQLTGHVSSCLLNMLVKLRAKAAQRDLPFALSGVNGFLEDLLKITNLRRVLPCFVSLADAFAEFGEFDGREQKRVDRRKAKRNSNNRSGPSPSPFLKYYSENRNLVWSVAVIAVLITGAIWWTTLESTDSAEYQRRVERLW